MERYSKLQHNQFDVSDVMRLCRFQIVSLPDGVDSDLNNGSWRIGDWADTLETPNIGFQAIVRWIPGPVEITREPCCIANFTSDGSLEFVGSVSCLCDVARSACILPATCDLPVMNAAELFVMCKGFSCLCNGA